MPAEDDTSSEDIAGLRFRGDTFDSERGFPLDRLDELEAYQALVVEAARDVWLEHHPTRKRVPDNFPERVELRLVDVNDGSSIPVLVPTATSGFEDMPDLLLQAIHRVPVWLNSLASGGSTSRGLSHMAVSAIKRLGKSFRDFDAVEMSAGAAVPFVYDQTKRATVLEALSASVPVDRFLIGRVEVLGVAQRFELTIPGHPRARGSFESKTVWDEFYNALADHGSDYYWMQCKYERTLATDEITVSDVTSIGRFAPSAAVGAARLAEFALLRQGWFDGHGEEIELDAILAASDLLTRLGDGLAGRLSIFPGIDGSVRLERLTSSSHTTLTIASHQHISGAHIGLDDDDEVWLDDGSTSDEAVAFLKQVLHG